MTPQDEDALRRVLRDTVDHTLRQLAPFLWVFAICAIIVGVTTLFAGKMYLAK